jgi:hypothetical protein
MQLCLPSHSMRFCAMRTNISASVQLGPLTLWGGSPAGCEGADDDLPAFEARLGCPDPREFAGSVTAAGQVSTESTPYSHNPSAGLYVDGYCEASPRFTMSSVIAEPTEGRTRKGIHKNQNVWCQADVTVNADAQCFHNTVAALKPRITQETYRHCNTE